MTLSTGTKLSHYEITSQIGKGGMGEVYQAKDTKLGRSVAIKVLPEEFAKDADRVARFQREAKLLASLNHPNIASIYGIEESTGTHFLVMELIEGQTLDERIKSGRIPVEESLKLALQIAEALEVAHERGVIHRDLKPANIKVTPDGKVKVLDFGLAKAFAGEQADLNLSNSPTLSVAATQQGVILGTAAYMSPEQARGKEVDKRADIWAFGVVLFEMLTGKQLFAGEDVSSTLARVLERDPDFSTLPTNLHPRIRFMLERCLDKDPKNRYGAICDARVDIEVALADPGGLLIPPAPASEGKLNLRFIFPWVAGALVLTAIIAGIAAWNLKPSEPRRVIYLDYELPKNQRLSRLDRATLAVSPDGNQIAYSTTDGLYLRALNEPDARLIQGTDEKPRQPFFSPDGQWIGYFSEVDMQLKKIPIGGGMPTVLCDARQLYGKTRWGEDGSIVYTDSSGIMRISSTGGDPETLIEFDTSHIVIGPQILPDGENLLYTRYTGGNYGNSEIIIQSLKSKNRKKLLNGFVAQYLPTGHLVYQFEKSIFAIPFDCDTLETSGQATRLIEGVIRKDTPHYALSDSGTLAYISGAPEPERILVWVDKEGREEPLQAPPNIYFHPQISPDRTKVAVAVGRAASEDSDICIWDLASKNLMKLTFEEGHNAQPIWTKDSLRVAFSMVGQDHVGIFWKKADNTGAIEEITTSQSTPILPYSWSKDEKVLVLEDFNYDIGISSMGGDRSYKYLMNEKFREIQPQISPKGQWIAYTSNQSGENEVYVRPFPEVNNGVWQITVNGGHNPLWSPDGNTLYYRNDDAVVAVEVNTDQKFDFGNFRTLFHGSYIGIDTFPEYGNNWDIHPDGKRFLMIKYSQPVDPPKIKVVVNWFEVLKEKMPVQ